jgi:hypothetical protein
MKKIGKGYFLSDKASEDEPYWWMRDKVDNKCKLKCAFFTCDSGTEMRAYILIVGRLRLAYIIDII